MHQFLEQFAADLRFIIEAWPDLSPEVKEKIIETIRKEKKV